MRQTSPRHTPPLTLTSYPVRALLHDAGAELGHLLASTFHLSRLCPSIEHARRQASDLIGGKEVTPYQHPSSLFDFAELAGEIRRIAEALLDVRTTGDEVRHTGQELSTIADNLERGLNEIAGLTLANWIGRPEVSRHRPYDIHRFTPLIDYFLFPGLGTTSPALREFVTTLGVTHSSGDIPEALQERLSPCLRVASTIATTIRSHAAHFLAGNDSMTLQFAAGWDEGLEPSGMEDVSRYLGYLRHESPLSGIMIRSGLGFFATRNPEDPLLVSVSIAKLAAVRSSASSSVNLG